MKLTEEEIVQGLQQVDGWKLEDAKWIVKKYRFPAFMDGIRFVNEVAEIAEGMNHHPFISIDYKVVTLRITSWNAGGLTKHDFDSAESYNRAYQDIVPS